MNFGRHPAKLNHVQRPSGPGWFDIYPVMNRDNMVGVRVRDCFIASICSGRYIVFPVDNATYSNDRVYRILITLRLLIS